MAKTKEKKQAELAQQARNRELWPVARFLKELRLKHRLFGVDEADVWQNIQRLCQLYEDALEAHRAKTEVLEQKFLAMEARTMVEEDHGEP